MKYIKLHNTDFTVSRIIFGGWAIGGWYWGGTDERDASRAILESLDCGINAFDTAPIYGMGKSESIIGETLKNHPDALIATKCGLRYDLDSSSAPFFEMNEYEPPVRVFRNLSKESVIYECEKSLKRLGRNHIDIYQIHWPDSSAQQEKTAEALNLLYGQGKIRSAGVCNYTVEKILELKKYLEVPLVSDQEKLSLMHRKSIAGNIPYDKKNNLTFLAYSPLAQGLLTNRVSMDRVFPSNDYRSKSEIMSPEFRKSVSVAFQRLEDIRMKYGCSYANIAVAWALHTAGENSCAIVGIRNKEQALENSRACHIEFNGDEVEIISETFSSLIYKGKW